jgi:hypothetical protein
METKLLELLMQNNNTKIFIDQSDLYNKDYFETIFKQYPNSFNPISEDLSGDTHKLLKDNYLDKNSYDGNKNYTYLSVYYETEQYDNSNDTVGNVIHIVDNIDGKKAFTERAYPANAEKALAKALFYTIPEPNDEIKRELLKEILAINKDIIKLNYKVIILENDENHFISDIYKKYGLEKEFNEADIKIHLENFNNKDEVKDLLHPELKDLSLVSLIYNKSPNDQKSADDEQWGDAEKSLISIYNHETLYCSYHTHHHDYYYTHQRHHHHHSSRWLFHTAW